MAENPTVLAIASGIEAKLRRLYYETPERAIRENPMMFMLAMRGLYEEAKELSGMLARTPPPAIKQADSVDLLSTRGERSTPRTPVPAPAKKKKAPPVPKPEKQ